MKTLPPHRYAAILALGCALLPATPAFATKAQEEGSPTAVLLGRARTLEQRGRLDLAKQDWAQVLLLDPNEAEALAGLVRAARAESRTADAAQYLARLRAAHPNDPQLARLENAGKGHDNASDLAEADRLKRSGDERGAFAIYRRIYGLTPPPGGPALDYYRTEAAVEGGRPQAIAGLRALADRYPKDVRYSLELGKLLLVSPRTRAEGRTLLERFPDSPEAVAALRSSGAGTEVASNAGSPARAGEASATQSSLSRPAEPAAKPLPKPSPAVPETSTPSTPQRQPEPARAASGQARTEPSVTPGTSPRPTFRPASASSPRHQGFASQEQAGFAALNQHRTAEAEQIFHDILARDATDPRALAGLGYLRVTAGDLKAAVGLFERAQENGDHSLALTRALVNAQYDLALQQAGSARTRGDVSSAETQYRAALRERPSDPEALEGLGSVLLQSGRAEEAIPVFTRLTQVRPMSPGAWRGLVISQASAGKAAGALAADARVPADAKAPLSQDSSYLQALSTARGAGSVQSTEIATAAPPARPAPAPPQTPTARASATPASAISAPAPAQTGKPTSQPSVPTAKAVAPAPQPASPEPTAPTQTAPVQAPAVKEQPSQVAKAEQPKSRPSAPPPPPPTLPPSTPATPPPMAAVEPPRTSAPTPKASAPAVAVAGKAPGKPSRRERNKAKSTAPSVAATTPPPAPPVATPVQPPRPEVAISAERVSQGEDALTRGENARAADLFRDAIHREPDASAGWKGLVHALRAEGRNGEAATALGQIPVSARSVLDRDASFQITAGEVYLASERPEEALHAYARAQSVFGTQRLSPPLELVLRLTALLAARNDDANLYRELLYLGDRRDLTDAQRREVQMIWTGWAVRRARSLAAAGDRQRAVTVLNATAEAFAGNNNVITVVADGYAGVGLPKEAVALYRTRDLSKADAHEIESAVGVAIAAHDFRAAKEWSRLGRDRFPNDPEMLNAAAELEQARGHEDRAVDLSRKAKALAPTQDPGQVLAAELRESSAGHGWRTAPAGQLAVLLAPSDAASMAAGPQGSRPFLPAAADPASNQSSSLQIPALTGFDEPSR